MAKEFQVEILTPGRQVLRAQVTEVVLPAYDGERGVLANHENFIGLLGTGAVKIVRDKDDYWFMVSSGVYEVRSGALTIYAEISEKATEVDSEQAKIEVEKFEEFFSNPAKFDPDRYQVELPGHERNLARLEVHRRTEIVN